MNPANFPMMSQDTHRLKQRLALVIAACLLPLVAHAQWQTQTFNSPGGWSAIYLHVDATHKTIDEIVPVEVEEVWYWRSALSTVQFLTSPQEPVDGGSQWLVWKRGKPNETSLNSLQGNSAFLVKVNSGSPITWSIKGRTTPPRYLWTSTGVNLLGYSTPTGAAPTLESFLLAQPNASLFDLEFYKYIGGDLSAQNPQKVIALRTENLERGQSYWIRSKSGSFNRYFGAFEVSLQDARGVTFGDDRSLYRIRLQNLTKNEINVNLSHLASEAPPSGETAIHDRPPLLLRGALNAQTLEYSFADLNGSAQTVNLKASGELGSAAEVVIGLNRSQMSEAAGTLYAGILRFADDLGFSQVDIPVSAEKASLTGLWVGEASIRQVRHDLTYFARNGDGSPIRNDSGAATIVSNRVDFGTTPRAFPLRMIVHVDAAGNASLLQRAYVGIASNVVATVATSEAALDPEHMISARRITTTHLPWSKVNTPWAFTGTFGRGNLLNTTVTTAHGDQSSNPFLHSYHPDHDNRNATFTATLPRGRESFDIVRDMALQLDAPAGDFSNITSAHREVTGTYAETITLRGKDAEQKQYAIQGTFTLSRLSEIATLTTTP